MQTLRLPPPQHRLPCRDLPGRAQQRSGSGGAERAQQCSGRPLGALQGSWGDIRIQDATLAETAAVLLGRVDLQDLTGAGYPSRLADEVCGEGPGARVTEPGPKGKSLLQRLHWVVLGLGWPGVQGLGLRVEGLGWACVQAPARPQPCGVGCTEGRAAGLGLMERVLRIMAARG